MMQALFLQASSHCMGCVLDHPGSSSIAGVQPHHADNQVCCFPGFTCLSNRVHSIEIFEHIDHKLSLQLHQVQFIQLLSKEAVLPCHAIMV